MRRQLLLAGSFSAAFLLPARATGEPAGSDAVIAQSLFEQGRTLLADGKVAEACVKFAESQRLDPGGGTALNLALCHEREGKIATAHAEFEAALAQAIKDGRRDREGIAREHMRQLAPRLPKVVIDVQVPVSDEEIKIDDRVLPRAAWGAPTSIDPGPHVIEARATGRETFLVNFSATPETTARAVVPPLAIDPNAGAPTSRAVAPQAEDGKHAVHFTGDPGLSIKLKREDVTLTAGTGRVTGGVYSTLCTSPCVVNMAAGRYSFAAATSDSGPVEGAELSVAGPTTVRATFDSSSDYRTLGWITMFGGPVVFGGGGALLTYSMATASDRCGDGAPREGTCSSYPLESWPLIAGVVLTVASLVTGIVLINKKDTASFVVTPAARKGAR